jgi:predicted HNH restriction endonuclease
VAEKVAKAGIPRKKNFLLYVQDGAVWRVRKKRPDGPESQPEMVADLGFAMDPSYIYFVDKDGDVSRVVASEVQDLDDDADQKDEEDGAANEKLPEELSAGAYREGQGLQITVNRYERDAAARGACLKHFGTLCQVCGVELSTVYGPIAAGLVHVHHLRPLSQVEGEYEVRPEHDLIPVCPNCHAVVHRRDPPLTPDELRNMMAQAKTSRA